LSPLPFFSTSRLFRDKEEKDLVVNKDVIFLVSH